MFLALNLAEVFLDTLRSIGYFFTQSPLGPLGDIVNQYSDLLAGQNWLIDFLVTISSLSLGEILFGATLGTLIVAKLWKFLLDLIPFV